MVAIPAQTAETTPENPLLTLTPDDGNLLHNLYALSRSLFALADHAKLPLHALLAWLNQPHIQQAIRLLDGLEDAAHRSAALSDLHDNLDSSEDPVERRRIATTMLRTVNTKPPRRERATARDASAPPSAPRSSRIASDRPHSRIEGAPRSARIDTQEPHEHAGASPHHSSAEDPLSDAAPEDDPFGQPGAPNPQVSDDPSTALQPHSSTPPPRAASSPPSAPPAEATTDTAPLATAPAG